MDLKLSEEVMTMDLKLSQEVMTMDLKLSQEVMTGGISSMLYPLPEFLDPLLNVSDI